MNVYLQGPSGNMSEDLLRTVLEVIENYLGDDPLEPWLRCIMWLKESFPPGSVQPVLQKVLEACTQTFLADNRYKSDLRYLRVWIQYADCCTDPGAIFPFLEANGVGQEHGLFYEAYATLLEVCRDFAKANDVYEVGISRHAQPVERLKSMHQSFRNRMNLRHRRKMREEQKALASRMKEGAQRPLADKHCIQGLAHLQTFQNTTREIAGSLPSLDIHMKKIAGINDSPAPEYIGSKIYGSTTDEAETSFEEERLCRWTQHQMQQLDSAIQRTLAANEYNIGKRLSSSKVEAASRASELFQSPNGKPVERMDYGFNMDYVRKQETSKEKLSCMSDFSEGVPFDQGQSIKFRSSLSGGSGIVHGVLRVQTSSPSRGTAGVTSSPMPAYGDITNSMKQFTDGLVMRANPNADNEDTIGHHGLLDLTMNTKIATEDILSMFRQPLACETSRPRDVSSRFVENEVSNYGTQEANLQIFMNEDPTSSQLIIQRPQRGSLPLSKFDDEQNTPARFSMKPKSFDLFVDQDLAISEVEKQHGQSSARPRAVVSEHIKPGVSTFALQWSCSQAIVEEDTVKSMGERERFQVFVDYGRPLHSKINHQDAGESKLAAPQMGSFDASVDPEDLAVTAVEHQPGAYIDKQLSPVLEETKSAVERCNARENSCNTRVGTSKTGVGLGQDLNMCMDENINVRPTLATKRPALPLPPRASWPVMTKNGQPTCIGDEEGRVESRESKKPRVHLNAEGPGVFDSENMNANMDIPEARMEGLMQPYALQESQGICMNRCTNASDTLEASPLLRNELKASLRTSTEMRNTQRKVPSGKVYPWDEALITGFLEELNPPLSQYKGFLCSTKKYGGKVSLASLKSGVKNKTLQLGCSRYQLRGCTGRGAFAQVYLAEDLAKNGGDGHRIVLKIQKPACPWEFYIYRQLDMRIPSDERSLFGRAQNIHVYADCSFMVCDFGEHGTLQDVLNAYLSKGQRMDEVLCTYYTIEMLHMLENLHKVGLIHGDFKPDNLLIRSDSEVLEDWTPDRPGAWKHQGVCLIDWGRSIDTSLFAEGTEFVGDSKTDGFRCTEMLEKKPWTFQVDTYGLCGVVHCLLHGSYMEIEKCQDGDSQRTYRLKAPYKRYWNRELWQTFFYTLLNFKSGRSHSALGNLRKSFEDYLENSAGLIKKLRQLLMKQNTLLRSRK